MNCIKVSVLQINKRLIPADVLLLYQLYQNIGDLYHGSLCDPRQSRDQLRTDF